MYFVQKLSYHGFIFLEVVDNTSGGCRTYVMDGFEFFIGQMRK